MQAVPELERFDHDHDHDLAWRLGAALVHDGLITAMWTFVD